MRPRIEREMAEVCETWKCVKIAFPVQIQIAEMCLCLCFTGRKKLEGRGDTYDLMIWDVISKLDVISKIVTATE